MKKILYANAVNYNVKPNDLILLLFIYKNYLIF